MKPYLIALTGLAIAVIAAQCTSKTEPAPETTAATTPKADPAAQIKRGEYLVGIAGCNDCHTPKVMTDKGPALNTQRLLSGHIAEEALPAITDKKMIAPGQWALFNSSLTAAVGPWGTSFAANLTPDDTGLGNWTFEQFEKALREGKSKGLDGTRPLLPPMPWQNTAQMTDEDMRAIFAYLKSIPAVKNAVPNPIPPASI
ncbi:MAG TPA: diheme cytochrome c-553 [Saprospirales bacterium]|nr:diheme cytochrome c-553 [Saprospirales bacterium]